MRLKVIFGAQLLLHLRAFYGGIGFLEELPIEKFYGIGKVTALKMYNLGIFKGSDLKQKTETLKNCL